MKDKHLFLCAFILAVLAGPTAAQAQYDYQFIEYPGVDFTLTWGINERGDVAGFGLASTSETFPFVYDSKTGTLENIASLAGFATTEVFEIDDAGNMVGSVYSEDSSTGKGFIRDKQGNFTVFSHPEAFSRTFPRAMNNKGLVTGYIDRPNAFVTRGFIYDPKSGTFTNPVPGAIQTIVGGINNRDDVVGNSFFFGALGFDDPCGDNQGLSRYAWLRKADGTLVFFNINGLTTIPRGINDNGEVAGFLSVDGTNKSFVIRLDESPCQEVTIADNELLQLPGVRVQAYGITNAGKVMGYITEPADNGFGFRIYGYVATPRKGGE